MKISKNRGIGADEKKTTALKRLLKKEDIVAPAADLVEVQSFLEHHIAASDAMAFAQLLDRHVASVGGRLPEARAEGPVSAGTDASAAGRPVGGKETAEEVAAAASEKDPAGGDRPGKSRSGGENDCPPRAKPSPQRSSPRSANHHRKPPPRRAAAKTGKATRRR